MKPSAHAISSPSIRKLPRIANSSSMPKHFTIGPYGSSGFSPLASEWKNGIVELSANISFIETRTAWTVSTLCNFRRRSM